MPKKSKRAKEKYPALKPELNLKTRYDLIDYDYLQKLSPKELEWLNKFTEEYTNADFRHEKKFHKTKKAKRERYGANNARNRCIFTRAKASGQLVYWGDFTDGFNQASKPKKNTSNGGD